MGGRRQNHTGIRVTRKVVLGMREHLFMWKKLFISNSRKNFSLTAKAESHYGETIMISSLCLRELSPAKQPNVMQSVVVANGKRKIGVDSKIRSNWTITLSCNSMVLFYCQISFCCFKALLDIDFKSCLNQKTFLKINNDTLNNCRHLKTA